MKKFLGLILIGLFFLNVETVHAVHPHVSYITTPTWLGAKDPARQVIPQITFVRNFQYTYTPAGGSETTVAALDINGLDLFLKHTSGGNTLITIPIVKLGGDSGTTLTVLNQSTLTGNNKRVIVQLPGTYLPGNHLLSMTAYTGSFIRQVTATIIAAPIPMAANSVMLFSGASSTIPSDWQACDGTNSTPNLKNKFIVGAGDTYAVNATGGRKTIAGHRLTIAQMPSHNHSYNTNSSAQTVVGGRAQPGNNMQDATSQTTGSKGGGAAHNHGDNRPPYHALFYICKN